MGRRKNRRVQTSGFAIAISDILSDYTVEAEKAFRKACTTVAEESVEKLKNTSPKKTGDYARGWTWRQAGLGFVVYNATDYQLTHLLEKGHAIVNGHGTYGRAPAHPHIKPVEEWAKSELVDEIGRLLK